jgi:hypothetical protein
MMKKTFKLLLTPALATLLLTACGKPSDSLSTDSQTTQTRLNQSCNSSLNCSQTQTEDTNTPDLDPNTDVYEFVDSTNANMEITHKEWLKLFIKENMSSYCGKEGDCLKSDKAISSLRLSVERKTLSPTIRFGHSVPPNSAGWVNFPGTKENIFPYGITIETTHKPQSPSIHIQIDTGSLEDKELSYTLSYDTYEGSALISATFARGKLKRVK